MKIKKQIIIIGIFLLFLLLIALLFKVHHHYVCHKYCDEPYAGKTTIWHTTKYISNYKCETQNLITDRTACTDEDGWVYPCISRKCEVRTQETK